MVFAGQTIPFVLMPHFVSPGQVRRVKHAVDRLCRVLDRFCDAYPTDAACARSSQLPDAEDSLIRIEPGFPRADAHLPPRRLPRGYDVKFLEFNADSPAGIGYTDVLYEGLRTTIELPRVRQSSTPPTRGSCPTRSSTLLDAYAHVRSRQRPARHSRGSRSSTSPARPSVPEFRIICAAAEAAGLARRPRHARRARLRRHHAARQGEPVQLVYRRALLEDLDQSDLVAAARDGRVCMVNPFRSRVANNKKLFALFQDPRFTHLIERRRGRRIHATIPWTRILRPGRGELRRLDHRPAAVRRRQPRAARAQAGLGLRRPRRLARHGDGAGRVGARSSTPTPTARTTSCRSTSRCRRRCSPRSRTATSRCA